MSPTRAAILAARVTGDAVVSFEGGRVLVTFESAADPVLERLIKEQRFMIDVGSCNENNITLFSRDTVDL